MANLFDIFKPNSRVAIIPQEEGPVKPFTIDVTTGEVHNYSAQVTEFPVEEGANITDHIIIKPFKLTLNCVISDNPITFSDLIESSIIGVGSSVFGPKAALAAAITSKIGGDLLAKGKDKISKTAKEAIEGFYRDGTLLTVATGLDVYSNMVIENFPISRNSANAASLNFTLTLKQITLVTKELVSVDLSQAIEEAAAIVNQGLQAATDAASSIADQGASLLVKLGLPGG